MTKEVETPDRKDVRTEELVKMYSDAVEKNDQETCCLVDQELFERDMYIWYDPKGKFVAKKH